MRGFGDCPVRLSSSTGQVLFKAPYPAGAFTGVRRNRPIELRDDLTLTFAQREPLTFSRDDHWIASRRMSKAEQEAFIKEVERHNSVLEEEMRRGAGAEECDTIH